MEKKKKNPHAYTQFGYQPVKGNKLMPNNWSKQHLEIDMSGIQVQGRSNVSGVMAPAG